MARCTLSDDAETGTGRAVLAQRPQRRGLRRGGDHFGAQRGSRAQDAMIRDAVLARPGQQRSQPGEQFEGLEDQGRAAIRPWFLQVQQQPAVGALLQTALGKRPSEGVPAQSFQRGAGVRGEVDPGVQVVAVADRAERRKKEC